MTGFTPWKSNVFRPPFLAAGLAVPLLLLVRPMPGDQIQPVGVIAHRGLALAAPENTIPAIQAALDVGCDHIEVDVRLTRDRVPVLLHDVTVDRTTSGSGRIDELPWAEASVLDAGARFATQFRGTRIPKLEEVVRLTAGRCKLVLDLKTSDFDPVVEVIRKNGASARTFYRPYTLRGASELRRLDPSAQLVLDVEKLVNSAGMREELFRSYPGAVLSSALENWSPDTTQALRDSGAPFFVNTQGPDETREKLQLALALGPTAILTDHPAWLLDLMASRRSAASP